MINLTNQVIEEVKWKLAPEVSENKSITDSLFNNGVLRISDWLNQNIIETIKSGPHRSVYKINLPELDFHLKHNRISGARAILREWFRTPKAQNEFQIALQLLKLGIPTIQPLAYGKTSGFFPDSFIISRSLNNTIPLADFWQNLQSQRWELSWNLRHQLITTLAKFLATLHRKGVIHTDLHPGNLMVEHHPSDGLKIIILDLHPVVIQVEPLDWKKRLANLAMLDRWAVFNTSFTDRMRLWQNYIDEVELQEGKDAFPFNDRYWLKKQIGFMKDLESTANRNLWAGFDLRCFGNNRRFKKLKYNKGKGHYVADLGKTCLDSLINLNSTTLDSQCFTTLKKSKSSEVICIKAMDGRLERSLIIKKIFVTKFLDPIVGLFRPDGATRSWQMGHALLTRQLPTPKPLALWHRQAFGLKFDGTIVTEEIPNAFDLPKYLEKIGHLSSLEQNKKLRNLTEALACLIRKMHDVSVSHRDLKAPNLMVCEINGEIQIWLIDLVGVRTHTYLGEEKKAQNLSRLNSSFMNTSKVSRTEKLRFLRQYLRWGLEGPFTWKVWWHKIGNYTSLKMVKNQKSGRPLA